MTTETPTSPGGIRTEIEGPLFWIIFDNQDRMNALNAAMWAALPERIAEAEANEAVRVVILRGAGDRAFSAGADISEFDTARTGDAARAYDALNDAAFSAVMDCAKPTLAMINGYCMGGGLELALCCDLRCAGEGAIFAIPAARLGIGYNPRWIRPILGTLTASQIKEIMFTGRRFDHEEARAMGLVNRLSEGDALERDTLALAGEIAANAPLTIRAAKRAIDEFLKAPQTPDLAALDALVEACFASEDYAEGRAAFQQKRKPVFKGR